VPILLFIGIAWLDHVRLVDQATQGARSDAEILREHTLNVLELDELLLRELEQRLRGMTWEQIRANRAALVEESRAVIARYPQVSAIGVTDRDGRQWIAAAQAGTPQPAAGMRVTDREFWSAQRDTAQGTLITQSFVETGTHRAEFALSRRRTAADGSFDGTVHVVVALSYFTALWTSALQDPPGSRLALVRADGSVLARVPEMTVPLPQLTAQNSQLMRHLPLTTDSTVYRANALSDNVDCIYVVLRVGGYPLYFSYAVPVASVLREWIHHLIILGGICGSAALALIVAVLWAMQQAHRLQVEQERRASAEKAALEGQRLEVLGQLTAGIAHDFGNVVQAVELGAIAIARTATEESIRQAAGQIRQAAQQGWSVTRRMLDFARRGAGSGQEAGVLDPEQTVSGVAKLLSGTLCAPCQLRCEIVSEALPELVRGHQSGLEGAIMNLAVNARDALPSGGEIVIRLKPERVDAGDHWNNAAGLAPGLYACVSVTDPGPGMPPDVLARAGELFFTTKPEGRGTGLGLASARAYALNNGGGFHIDSTVGVGTTVRLWLPAVALVQVDDEVPHQDCAG
jgi:two-component system NtrC family sensor kinase